VKFWQKDHVLVIVGQFSTLRVCAVAIRVSYSTTQLSDAWARIYVFKAKTAPVMPNFGLLG